MPNSEIWNNHLRLRLEANCFVYFPRMTLLSDISEFTLFLYLVYDVKHQRRRELQIKTFVSFPAGN